MALGSVSAELQLEENITALAIWHSSFYSSFV
jgi:hypothetical protein